MSSPRPRVLVVDDDEEIRTLLVDYLGDFGFETFTAPDGDGLLERLDRQSVDVVVLDVQLPGADGFELCRRIRSVSRLPVLMLTARSEETDRVVGLEIGADDYLVKPFSPRELVARLKALLRRAETADAAPGLSAKPRRVPVGAWMLDVSERHLVGRDGLVVPLSAAEFRLLKTFVERPHRVLSRDQLLDATQGREATPFDRSIDVLIGRLRRRLGDDARSPELIRTVRGEGYLFSPTESR